ncbi:MAG: putative glycoside hydrolase, partial [Pseudomonadota bacterium]
EGVRVVAYDRASQEDSLRVSFDAPAIFAIASSYPLDYSREANGAMELSFMAKSLTGSKTVSIGAGCVEMEDCENFHPVELGEDWAETRISLRCAASVRVDLRYLKSGFALKGQAGDDVALSDIVLKQESSESIRCD